MPVPRSGPNHDARRVAISSDEVIDGGERRTKRVADDFRDRSQSASVRIDRIEFLGHAPRVGGRSPRLIVVEGREMT